MNDPGLDNPIGEVGADVDTAFDQFDGTDEEEQKKYLDPRYAFAPFS